MSCNMGEGGAELLFSQKHNTDATMFGYSCNNIMTPLSPNGCHRTSGGITGKLYHATAVRKRGRERRTKESLKSLTYCPLILQILARTPRLLFLKISLERILE